MTSRLVLIVAVTVAICAHGGGAQTVPLLSGDLTAGRGSTSGRAGDVWFLAPSRPVASGDLAVRLGSAGQIRPVIVVGYSVNVGAGLDNAGCSFTPGGGCYRSIPNMFGPSVGVGVQDAIGRRLMLGATVGVASLASQAQFAEAEASWKLVPHFAVVGKAKYFNMPYLGQHVWFAPITAGARLTW